MAPRTPLLRPREYFEDRGFDSWHALAAVGVTLLGLAAVIVAFGVLASRQLSAGQFEGTPPGGFTAALWSAIFGQLVGLFFLTLLGWGIVTVVLHLVARAALSHEGRFGETLVVTGWGFVPSLVPTAVGFVLVALALGDVTATTPQGFLEGFRANIAATGPVQALVGFAAAAWQTYIYAHGLAVEFDTNTGIAAVIGGVVAYGFWILALI